MVRRCVFLVLLGVLVVAGASSLAQPGAPARTLSLPAATELLEQVAALTGPDMAGRGSATAGGDRAARRIAEWLADGGLRPGGEGGTYLQPFTISTGTRLAAGSALDAVAPAHLALAVGRQWVPHGGSAQGEAEAAVVFVGYGVSAPERGYDDYAGLDVRGALVLALTGAPPHLAVAPASRLEKLIVAKARGASGILLVGDALPSLDETETHIAIVSGTVTAAAADALLAPCRRTVAGLREQIAATRRPASIATGTTAHLRVALETEERRTANVIGIVPGADPVLGAETVVVGAHYDHLGVVKGTTYPGADDNASGTSVVVALARAFGGAARAHPPARTLVFALFSGEELGLLGSEHYVGHPVRPLARTVLMLNFDEVGRMRDHRLEVGGVDSATGLREIVADAAATTGVDIVARGTPYAPSDHTSFYGAGVPVLFFYTGMHDDYHQPSDTVDRIDGRGMAAVAEIGGRIIARFADAGARPVYASVPRRTRPEARGGPRGVFLGVATDTRGSDGVRLTSVVAGSAAARAGMRRGDVLVRFADAPIESFEALRRALRDRHPGESVRLVYIRDGEIHDISATLGER